MNSCWGGVVNGVQQMGTCDYLSLVMWIVGFLGFCLILWGFFRSLISTGLEGVSIVAGSEQGTTTFKKASRTGYWLMGIGAVMFIIALLIFHFLPA